MTSPVAGVWEVLAWWLGLTALWLVLVSAVDPLEATVGGGAALLAAVAARAARRAVERR